MEGCGGVKGAEVIQNGGMNHGRVFLLMLGVAVLQRRKKAVGSAVQSHQISFAGGHDGPREGHVSDASNVIGNHRRGGVREAAKPP